MLNIVKTNEQTGINEYAISININSCVRIVYAFKIQSSENMILNRSVNSIIPSHHTDKIKVIKDRSENALDDFVIVNILDFTLT